MNHLLKRPLSNRDAFLFILTLLLLYVVPLILANVYYRDDTERILNPAAPWYTLGRPGADLLMRLFTFNLYELTDTAPLTLLLGVLFFAWTLVYVARRAEGTLNIAALSPYILLFFNPFFLQNLSYKYDSFPMVVALALSILAFFCPRNRGLLSYLLPTLLLFCALTLYQPCANIFIGLYGANLMINFFKVERSPLQETVWAAVVMLLTNSLYILIIDHLLALGGGNRGNMIGAQDALFWLTQDWLMLKKLLTFVLSKELKFLFYPALLCVIWIFALRLAQFWRAQPLRLSMLLSLLLILCSPLVLFIALLGPLFLLKEGVTDVRVLCGFSATLFVFAHAVYQVLARWRPAWLPLCTLPLFYFLAFSFQYGNAVRNQRDYEARIFGWLSYDLLSLNANGHGKILLNNYPDTAPVTQKIVEHQALIDMMFSPAYNWTARRIIASYGISNIDAGWGPDYRDRLNILCAAQTAPLRDNKFYAIYALNGDTIVWLKNKYFTVCGPAH
ncbi:glucosyltransferase domain-containing protein [Edwardsiella anguillarum]|uniref:glucosyltransferase domain-containing protein n=1 Tax=Edwardsiella anguillarum TaxID=1821960 RepID=UPI0024B6B2A1|nr:glucosyltransferase domain-containing protein [Edwardsiella anguillarum]WHP78850.1 glucosyltransferase domain-containing protein [Edwardsiella anguillarum]WHQ16255.1 glucosyltransferase domain-containing protein [Edwardsiella anguillarum]WHQ19788.1 glucosyltransferase domain-containing protein [Edwardsiella anguillarum]WHQ23311.1 glucosyltransferase domain-containing protein [Edwardsiella anguillarum]WHQ26884.1 glucosyltransferase domain-containing protein [Edwardsiella anguillarum]